MATTIHTFISLLFCQSACLLIYHSSPQLISLLHGPSAQIFASDREAALQSILASSPSHEINDAACDEIYQPAYDHNDDYRSAIFRDAGAIAALFSLLLILVPKFTSIHYSARQRFQFLLLTLPVYVTPALIGQIVFQKSAPVEILLLKTWGLKPGILFAGYCSTQSLLGGALDGRAWTVNYIIHELHVVGVAGLIVFLILGIMPFAKK